MIPLTRASAAEYKTTGIFWPGLIGIVVQLAAMIHPAVSVTDQTAFEKGFAYVAFGVTAFAILLMMYNSEQMREGVSFGIAIFAANSGLFTLFVCITEVFNTEHTQWRWQDPLAESLYIF